MPPETATPSEGARSETIETPQPGPGNKLGPKNIVLFSDGTGNSASKAFKTNVWRTYQALDLNARGPNEQMLQVAFYRDGVGTETFKPLALLGGVFGFGVMRDVKALYKFLCRNYADGDRIYAFGFSRGAFTIRLLVGLVAVCGLVQATDERELEERAGVAYRTFRKDFLYRAAQQRKMVWRSFLTRPQVDLSGVLRPHIKFLGLWDTVDAYGMPIEELKQGIDRYLYPMSLADRRLSSIVEQACHALSLDDERPTFRPVLWDESQAADKARIEQIWFAGVHANVGGGYPIDDLSLVPLVWMLDKATAAGLSFLPDEMRFFRTMQNVHGTMYDSRSGVAGYYRYGPRSLQKLCDDEVNGVTIAGPEIHASVLERIARRHRAYAPIGLPIGGLTLTSPDTGQPIHQNPGFVVLAWDAVFWRRITYFMTLALTAFLLVVPFFMHASANEMCGPEKDGTCSVLAWAINGLASLAPGWSRLWVNAWRDHLLIGSALLGALAFLFFYQSSRLQREIERRSEWAWAALKGNRDAPPVFEPPWADRIVRAVRLSPFANRLGQFYDRQLIPFLFGAILPLGLVIAALVYLLTRGRT